MSVLRKRPGLRWFVPAGIAAVALAAGLGIGSVTASATPSLPPRDAAQLLVDLQTSSTRAFSGTVVVRADLGLPAVMFGDGGPDLSDLTALTSGSHTLRVWYSSPDQARVALLDTLGETDIIASDTDLWIWSSRKSTATHRTLPAHTAATPMPTPSPLTTLSPTELADLVLSRVGDSTDITTAGPVRVAGRDAYELVARPRDEASLIGTIRVAIDAKAHVPLRVQVFPRTSGTAAGAAAIDAAFTQISFARPDPQHFAFNPPPGTSIIEDDKPERTGPMAALTANDHTTTVVGTGWTAVVVAAMPETDQNDGYPVLMMDALPTVSGSWGSGHLITSPLASILITDDARVLAGAVTPERLYQAAADPHAKAGS